MAGPFPLRAVRMAVAIARPRSDLADAPYLPARRGGRRRLEPPELLVGRASARGGAADGERVSLVLELRHRLLVERAKLRHVGQDFVGKEPRFDAPARGELDFLEIG